MPIRPRDYTPPVTVKAPPEEARERWEQLAERLWQRTHWGQGYWVVARQAHMADGIWYKVERVTKAGQREVILHWTKNAEGFGTVWALQTRRGLW